MRTLIKPNFQRSIVNISSSIAVRLGCPNTKPTLPELDEALRIGHKNIVLVVLDGLGIHPLEKNLPEDSFLRKNIRSVLTSVFPSTTTNATTSLRTNAYPMEHGWFGWSVYFEKLKRAVDLFPNVDSWTGEPVEKDFVKKTLPASPFYFSAKNYETNAVLPPFCEEEPNRYVWNTLEEFFEQIRKVCKKDGRQFVYAYCTQPDGVMHEYGVSSYEASAAIRALNDGVEKLASSLEDTLLIVTADHGQVDVHDVVEIYRDEELLSLLRCPPYLEARASAFRVKEGKERAFEALFQERYGKDFQLFSTEKLIAENYFGGAPERKHGMLLGDYIAVGVTDKIMRLTPRGHVFKGHHTSLTEEMLVPLLLLG